MKIAVIGEGNVGGTLARRWSEAKHDVVFGVRDPQGNAADGIARASVEDAVRDAKAVVFAIPASAAEGVVRAVDLKGKIVVDCMNPIAPGFSGIEQAGGLSLAERITQWSPGARVVKAFNTIGFNVMENPAFGGERASLLYAGDDEAAKSAVASLASDLGFDPVDAGPLVQARTLEHFAWLWISMAMKYGHGRDIAFRLMKR